MDRLQGDHYYRDYDYRAGSPHLRHRQLHESLMNRVADAIRVAATDDVTSVLEVGAGDGSITERLLALGWSVTGTEMSRASVDGMNARFGSNDRFRAVHDRAGDLAALDDSRFDAILYSSVLHHIPDYLAHLAGSTAAHLKPGGSLITIQDPLWYARIPGWSRRITEWSYLSWRLAQGDLLKGIRTRVRRRRNGLSETEPGDSIEYHVVRDGVDEQAIAGFMGERFDSVNLYQYWSSQGTAQQKFGEKLGLLNTFAAFATGYDGDRQ